MLLLTIHFELNHFSFEAFCQKVVQFITVFYKEPYYIYVKSNVMCCWKICNHFQWKYSKLIRSNTAPEDRKNGLRGHRGHDLSWPINNGAKKKEESVLLNPEWNNAFFILIFDYFWRTNISTLNDMIVLETSINEILPVYAGSFRQCTL